MDTIKTKMTTQLLRIAACVCLLVTSSIVGAAEKESVLSYLTDQTGQYMGPSVEDNVAAMDTDKNGFADVYEVRAFLELKHGKGYEKELLDKWVASAGGASCNTPFAKEFYSVKAP